MAPADFFLSVGFKTVRPHPRYPRLRLELRTALSWKSDVEYALEKLLGSMSPETPAPPGPARARGHAASDRPADAAARGCSRAAVPGGQSSRGGDHARSSLTSIEPVGTSCSIGKYIRCTAATIASTTRSRNSGSISRARSVGEVR